MAVRTPDLVAGLVLGSIEGFVITPFFDTGVFQSDEVTITLGTVEANGKIYTLTADTSHVITGFIGGFSRIYFYIDDSASSPPDAVFINSTTSPVFDVAKNGFYNGDDRYIGSNTEKFGAGNAIGYFDVIVISDRYIRNYSRDFSRITTNQSPSPGLPNWVVPNTVPNTNILIPTTSVEIGVQAQGRDGTPSTALIAVASKEWADVNTTFNQAPLLFFGQQNVLSTGFVPLGPSKDIRVAGEIDDDAFINVFPTGYGHIR